MAVVAFRRGRKWLIVPLLVLAASWWLGSAKALLVPAVAGIPAYWLCAGGSQLWRKIGLTLALGGALASAVLCWIFPLPEVPPRPGGYPVGTFTYEVPGGSGSPPLMVQVWYPGRENKVAPRARWLDDPALAPHFPFHRQASAWATSRIGLELAKTSSKLPVIFYEHAWNGHRQENVVQVEELASQGFVIIAVDHPGQAGRTRYPDGHVVTTRLKPDYLLLTEDEVTDFETLAKECLVERKEQLGQVKKSLEQGYPVRLAGKLDLDRMGIFGFSFGGTSALHCCAVDPSFYAGANEDGMYLGDKDPLGPFLFFDEQLPFWLLKPASPGETPEDAQTRRCELRIRQAMANPGQSRVILDNTRHPAFTDQIYTCRIPWLARVGTRPTSEIHQIITRHLADFFKGALPGKQQ